MNKNSTRNAIIQLENLAHAYPSRKNRPVIGPLSLEVIEGEYLVILGPSGSGKTTLLRILAGLEAPNAGRVIIAGQEMSSTRAYPPEKRGVGMVFQDYALFPHMTAAENIAFGLSKQKSTRKERVSELLDLVGLKGYERRYPHELSGGEQQRVALARTLAPNPKVILLDEPFSNLDADLRRSMRHEVREILKKLGSTVILVTHDQEEAFELGDRVAVLSEGRIAQIGTPDEIYHHPATRFVAEFIGRADFLEGCWCERGIETELGVLPPGNGSKDQPCGRTCEVLIRPDMVEIEPDEKGQAVIVEQRFSGMKKLYCLELPSGRRIHSLQPSTATLKKGSRVRVHVDRSHCVCFSKD
ncbi:ABC transporter ATP-binding protein [Candidatus Acetothermia bacterium]|nr:ABC transporter ATP-binding protein [Candidatus Acetothermia bacterium]